MAEDQPIPAGRVAAIWRYPVKSMLGEELDAADVTERGLAGDRQYALIDPETGKVVSAKNPRRWPNLFSFRSTYPGPDAQDAARITHHDGRSFTTDQADIDAALSAAVGRPVRLSRTPTTTATAEGYWPDHDWLADRDQVFDFKIPPGTFFDAAAVHLLTTATLARLAAAAPGSRVTVPRFRPNLLIEYPDEAAGFVEDQWIGRTIRVGEVHLRIDEPCPRCVMTTLAQGDLPRDPAALRAAVWENRGNVGVYAAVVRGGRLRIGDTVAAL